MARKRDPKRDQAFDIWKQHNGNITNRLIAEQLEVDEKKIAVWKQRDKWNVVQQNNVNVVQQNKKSARNSKKPKRRSGNPNPKNQFSERNSAALKHGLFSRYMPKETLTIMGMIAGANPADLIWMQIEIQFAAIIRAQEIMFVESKDELIKELKKRKDTEWGKEIEYEFQFAWDRQATFMNAQSKAIAELRGSIKQFLELADSADERRLKLEQMQLSIDKTKAEIDKLQGDKGAAEDWVTALKEVAEKRKQVQVNDNE